MPNTYNEKLCQYDIADHPEHLQKHKNAKLRATNAVVKFANQKGCFSQHTCAPLDAILSCRAKVETIEKNLAAALDDPDRLELGKRFPFQDIIGDEYFQFL